MADGGQVHYMPNFTDGLLAQRGIKTGADPLKQMADGGSVLRKMCR